MVNAHSHAFQRDLRGAAERPAPEAHAADDFWSWREAMYRLAGAHDPDSMRAAAGRVYAEMAAAGYGAVGEFHYVHHQPDGTPYDDPNAMAIAVAEAARAAGLAIVLLPAAYHRAGWDGGDLPPTAASAASAIPTSRRSSAASTRCAPGRRTATACTSASPRTASAPCPRAGSRRSPRTPTRHGLVRHVHAHEQPRELEECRAEHGVSPIELLHRTGFLGPRTSVIHGIHVDADDVAPAGRERHDRRLVPDDRGQPRRRPLPGARLPRRRRADRDRDRLAGPHRPVRGDARARDARPPRAPHAPRAARRLRRPLGRAGPRTAARASGSRTPARSRSTATIPTCAGSPTRTCRSAVATCARASAAGSASAARAA